MCLWARLLLDVGRQDWSEYPRPYLGNLVSGHWCAADTADTAAAAAGSLG
jgi:hypothetical protein